MDVYLPIANLSVNALLIVLLGGGVGLLSGMFGVGGGFLTTPLLIVYGIPPTVAAASAASQVTGASVSGVFAHGRRGGIDVKMGVVLVTGGLAGSLFGAWLFRLLQAIGQIDTVIAVLYVVMLGSIGGLMAKEAAGTIMVSRDAARGRARPRPAKRRHHPLVAALPLRTRFYKSGLYISPLAPLLLGFFTGIMTILLGVGGGFILVPAMVYLLGMATSVVLGTSLFQTLFVTAAATMVHALTTHAVDIVLAALLLLGSVAGAQVGARLAGKVKPEYLRLLLAAMVLLVGLRIFLGLVWRPEAIFTVELT